MSELVDFEAVRHNVIALPIETYQAGETVIADGSTTGKVLVLEEGAVEVVKDGVQLAEITEAGAVFGELSALLGQPHAADVRALKPTTFHVADATSFLRTDPTTALYVATIVAKRLEGSNQALVAVKQQLDSDQPRRAICKMLDQIIQGYGRYGDSYYQSEKWQQAIRIKDACLALAKKYGRREENIKGIIVVVLNLKGFSIWLSSFASQLHVLDIWQEGAGDATVANLQWSHVDDLTIVSFRRGSWEKELLELAERCCPA